MRGGFEDEEGEPDAFESGASEVEDDVEDEEEEEEAAMDEQGTERRAPILEREERNEVEERKERRKERSSKTRQKKERSKDRNESPTLRRSGSRKERKGERGGRGERSGGREDRGGGRGERNGGRGEREDNQALPILNPLKRDKLRKRDAEREAAEMAPDEITAADSASGYHFRFASMDSPPIDAHGAGETAAASTGVAPGADVFTVDSGGSRSGADAGSEEAAPPSKKAAAASAMTLITPEMLARLSAEAHGETAPRKDAGSRVVSYDLKMGKKKKY